MLHWNLQLELNVLKPSDLHNVLNAFHFIMPSSLQVDTAAKKQKTETNVLQNKPASVAQAFGSDVRDSCELLQSISYG